MGSDVSSHFNVSLIVRLTIISLQALQAISHRRHGVSVKRALRGQCVMPCGGENKMSIRMTDSRGQVSAYGGDYK